LEDVQTASLNPPAIALRALRETLNFSQMSWAILLGVEKSTVWRWETGATLVPQFVLQNLHCRLNHDDESWNHARKWRARICTRPDVEQLLTTVGLLNASLSDHTAAAPHDPKPAV
jgi:transcriptional regulator with XRE-family HTH domain